MTFFVDANVFIYAAGESEYRAPCQAIVDAIASEQADGRSSPLVLEEVWHFEVKGPVPGLAGLAGRAYELMAPLLPVDDEAFRISLTYDAVDRLQTADRLHAGTCLAHGIDTIVTADRGFDGVRGLRRVDPLDRRALARVLG